MMKEADQKLFDDILKGNFNIQDKTAFEERLKADADFKSDWELYQSMDDFLDVQVKNEDALAALSAVHNQNIDTAPQSTELKNTNQSAKVVDIKSSRRSWMIAATIAFFLCALGYFNSARVEKVDNYALIMDELLELPANSGVRGLDAKMKLDSAIMYFDLRDFDKSKDLFLQLQTASDTINRYLGFIDFIKKDHKSSLDHFSKIESTSAFYAEALEVQVYNLILQNNLEDAKTMLNKVPVNYFSKRKKARISSFYK